MYATLVIRQAGVTVGVFPERATVSIWVARLVRRVHVAQRFPTFFGVLNAAVAFVDLLADAPRSHNAFQRWVDFTEHISFNGRTPNIRETFVHRTGFLGVNQIRSVATDGVTNLVATNIQTHQRRERTVGVSAALVRTVAVRHRRTVPKGVIVSHAVVEE